MPGPPARASASGTRPRPDAAAEPARPSASEAGGGGALGSVALVLLWAAALFGLPSLVAAAAALLGAPTRTALPLAALALGGVAFTLLCLARSRGGRSLAL
jgi:hypothetical protein